MIGPLVVLAVGAVLAGALMYHHALGDFLGRSPSFSQGYHQAARAHREGAPVVRPTMFGQVEEQHVMEEANPDLVHADHRLHWMLMFVSGLISLAGIYAAYQMHLKDRAAADRLAARHPGVVAALEHKYWIDEAYQAAIVEPLRRLGQVFFFGDRAVVDGLVKAISFTPIVGGFFLKLTTQRGYLQGYAVTMLFGVAVILLFVFL